MEKIIIDEELCALGNAPAENEKIIYIHQSHKVDTAILDDIFQFALEAYASGYNLMVPMYHGTMTAVLDAAFQLDKPVYVMMNDGFDNFRVTRRDTKVMLLRGGFLTLRNPEMDNPIANMMKARILSVVHSTCTLILDNDYQDIAGTSLDMGHEIAVLRSTMKDPGIRMLVKEGAPVLDTFSNWLELPRAISFPMEHGPFVSSITDRRYSVILL